MDARENNRIAENTFAKTGLIGPEIRKIMGITDENLTKSIASGRAAVEATTGEKQDRARKLLKAFEIEAQLRSEGK